jgi:hypothetical protein
VLRSLVPPVAAFLLLSTAGSVWAAENATGSLSVTAQFSSRTSLRVSTELLRFDVPNTGETATAAVDFSAAARTHSGSDVVLSVEPVNGVGGPHGAAASSLNFVGEGEGTSSGTLCDASATVAGRWVGSGLRTGRLVFSLRATASGTYTLPLRFVLSAP